MKSKVSLTDETLRIWLAEQIEGFTMYVDGKMEIQKPTNAREHWMMFASWLRMKNHV